MTLNSTFTVTAKLREINDDGSIAKNSENDFDLNITMGLPLASAFAYKFCPYYFHIDNQYKVVMKTSDELDGIDGIMFLDEKNKKRYLVVNQKHFMTDIIKGLNLLTMVNNLELLLLPEEDEE